MGDVRQLFLWSTAFAVAFGVVEGAVVVYLRDITYPDGFRFPLREIEGRLIRVELVREAATLVLLVAVAGLAARGGVRRFAVLRPVDWAVEIVAALLILGSFFWNVPAVAAEEVPTGYPWWLFLLGWLGGIGWFAWRWSRRRGSRPPVPLDA